MSSTVADRRAAAHDATAPGRHRPRPTGAVERSRDLVVGALATVGAVAVAWAAASALFGLSIIVFATGSMAPTMPTGTAAIVHTVPAADLSVGDVVTVDQAASSLPVTHRIVGIEGAGDAAARTLTLRGDDNDFNDSTTYTVTEAPRVVVAVPGAGTVLSALRSPAAMLGAAVVVAVLVTWALWPSREVPRDS